MEISKEIIAKAKACETEEEIKALAEENKIEITDEEIKLILAQNSEGELAEEELEAVSGGRACKRNAHEMVWFDSEEEVQFIFNVGDVAQAYIGLIFGSETATVEITERVAVKNYDTGKWRDMYDYKRISGSPTHWGIDWQPRPRFQK